jgi:heme exporter protein A
VTSLVVDDVSRRFGRRWALAHVSVRITGGDAWMLLGNNGSGKSTLLRCLATALRVHEGHIRLDGRDVWADRHELRPTIGFLGHQTHLYDDLSGLENLHVWARLGGSRGEHAEELLERVGLDPGRRDPVRVFSAGMRRRLALARLLLKSPRLVLLDEPFTALDPGGRELVVDVVRTLRAAGATLVVATHLFEITRRVCEQAIVLDAGAATYVGPAEGVRHGVAFE